MNYFPNIENIRKAADTISAVADTTPLLESIRYSKLFNTNILLKREDLHRVRSYKIRGAYNKISSLSNEERKKARKRS
ncbi:MAG: pyridoxal-phosphate dependent enzyme, partial [Cellulophaga sp.]|uniref:pyridoxal-phosphate dependent enzyme n=1 Tax=Cellulophaga sp. TaxID=1972202 RepID=UPI003262D5EE